MGAQKNDVTDNKSALQFIHPDLILGVGNAMGAGKIKYGGWNFLKGHGKLQLCAAIIRHTLCIMRGEDIDEDTTELFGKTIFHWDCIVANINMLIWQREEGTLVDDGPEPSTATTVPAVIPKVGDSQFDDRAAELFGEPNES